MLSGKLKIVFTLGLLFFTCNNAYAQAIADFTLNDHRGTTHQLSDYRNSELLVLFVQLNGDAASRYALPILVQLQEQFLRRNIKFLLLNASDDQTAIAAEMAALTLELPVLLDRTQSVARALGIQSSGEVLIIDPKLMELLYRGPVDDQSNFDQVVTPARNQYLRDALNNLLIGVNANFNVPAVRGTPLTGNGNQAMTTNSAITPYRISISDAAISDLQQRLSRNRTPDQLDGINWEYGTDSSFLQKLLTYWRQDFDWRGQESKLNAFDQYKTEIDGLGIHFIHQRSPHAEAIPLLLVHGWPGSIAEFHKIIGPLTDPEAHGGAASDAFHVIAPSLPGFGFSDKPSTPGYSPERIAHLLAALMDRLGYDRYGLQGGDWGAIINRSIAANFPDRVIGLHSNFVLAGSPASSNQEFIATPEELEKQQLRETFMQNERGYQQIQGTKPQTLGYALNDSPAGLAAWIVEKFHGWSDIPQDGSVDLTSKFTMDELLTNVSIYWFTETITSSMRIYYENRTTPLVNPVSYITVPTGGAIFPAELIVTPKAWAQSRYNIVHWTIMPRGGHFAAMEEPELLLNDVRLFYRTLR
jgi:epoxide hydrolase